MSPLVTYEAQDSIATIVMDDGKMNVLSPAMFAALNAAFDRAAKERAVVVLTGREGVFSAGFDMRVLTAGGREAADMVRTGFELAERMLSFPMPIVVACSGHALAMGVFLVLAGDHRVGAIGAHKIGANEVAIGITMPFFGVEICRQRLAPAHFHRAVVNAEIYTPEDAVAAGFLDRVVPASELGAVARSTAARLAKLDLDAHAASKLRARGQALKAIRSAIETDATTFAGLFAAAS
jgi:enoyl-CoA hydratase